MDWNALVPQEAIGMQLTRRKGTRLVQSRAVHFATRAGLIHALRLATLTDSDLARPGEKSHAVVDVLDADGDIIGELGLATPVAYRRVRHWLTGGRS